jgi:hypothetical protein
MISPNFLPTPFFNLIKDQILYLYHEVDNIQQLFVFQNIPLFKRMY